MLTIQKINGLDMQQMITIACFGHMMYYACIHSSVIQSQHLVCIELTKQARSIIDALNHFECYNKYN